LNLLGRSCTTWASLPVFIFSVSLLFPSLARCWWFTSSYSGGRD
jgi:hypothetical protein